MSKIYSQKIIYLILLGILFSGCSKIKIKEQKSVQINPEHYSDAGYKYIEKKELNKAFESFDRALQEYPEFSPALVGTAIIYGMQRNYKAAFKQIKKAKGIEKQIGLIQLHIMEKGEDWDKKVKDEFDKGIKIDPENSVLWYYMGVTYKINYSFDNAEIAFKKIIEINKDFVKEAKEELVLVQKIRQAAPDTLIGKKIILIDTVNRAELAALFIEELKLDKLFDRKGIKNSDISFNISEQDETKTEMETETFKISDISNHALKLDIEAIVKLQIRGLEILPDSTFKPDKKVTKIEIAVMIEDILSRFKNDNTILTRYIGASSPFIDIRNDHFAFNAVMIAATDNILTPKSENEFGLQDEITGIDALLAIKKLKEKLK